MCFTSPLVSGWLSACTTAADPAGDDVAEGEWEQPLNAKTQLTVNNQIFFT